LGIFKACSPVFIALIAAINLHQPLLAATPDSDVCLSVDLSANTGDSTIHGQQVMVRGGAFTMGSNRGFPEEQPARVATVGDFWIDAHEVTNAQFRRFVEATDYITSAERPPPHRLSNSSIDRKGSGGNGGSLSEGRTGNIHQVPTVISTEKITIR